MGWLYASSQVGGDQQYDMAHIVHQVSSCTTEQVIIMSVRRTEGNAKAIFEAVSSFIRPFDHG